MKKIIHLSDLHFGKADWNRAESLTRQIAELNPDMVVISGDFTEGAKEEEFKAAKEFIKSLRKPVFVVPGNHDVPFYNVIHRFRSPMKRYKEFISNDLDPFYVDDEVALIGINSARSFAISAGRVSKEQIDLIENRISKLDPSIVKIIVCHHPFDLPLTKHTHHKHTHKVVGRAKMAMNRLAKLGVDIFLTGHLHIHHVSDSTMRYKIKDYCALIAQAGTAFSNRPRGEPVSFNTLTIDRTRVQIDHYLSNKNEFNYNLASSRIYTCTDHCWKEQQ